MLENKSSDFKTLILLKLTKNLIENSSSAGLYKLEKLINSGEIKQIKISIPNTKEDIKEQIKKDVKEKLSYVPSIKIKESDSFIVVERDDKNPPKNQKPTRPQQRRPPQMQQRRPPMQRMPPQMQQRRPPMQRMPQKLAIQDELPANLQYLKPTKQDIVKVDIDLGKLNPFLQDRNVKTIETEGPDQMIFVTGSMGRMPTGIKLTKEEIDELVDRFSRESKIPKMDGLFKVLVGNIQLTAMVSESLGTRFIIKKL